jgi:DNA-binding GntR family transcriptional regulator
MSGLSGGAVDHLVPVVEIVALLVGALVAIAGGLWAGFRWLRGQIRESFEGLTRSEQFRKVVSEIVTDATVGWNDLNNRLHEEHRRSIAELRKRDDERADAVKRLHGRVDSVWERIGTK